MEKTGSQNESQIFVDLVEPAFIQGFELFIQKEYTRSAELYNQFQDQILNLLEKLNDSRDIDLLINTEDILLNAEINNYAEFDPKILPSLEAALIDLDTMKKASGSVRDPEGYLHVEKTQHPTKKLKSGVPIDGCHIAANRHITRLENRLRSIGSLSEKKVTAQRIANTRLIKNIYIELQKKALGIEDRGKDKGGGR